MNRTAAAVGLIATMMTAWIPCSRTSARFHLKSCFARAAGMAANDVATPVLVAAARFGADFLAVAMKVPPFVLFCRLDFSLVIKRVAARL
jgi:hypothetical protein